MTDLPRLRIFAGPNGSGKSTIKSVIRSELLGVYVNPDEIEQDIRKFDFLDLQPFRIRTTAAEILAFFQNSTLLARAELLDEAELLRFNDDKLSFYEVSVNSYFASVAADFIRHKLLETATSFTFETVMSSPDKVAFLQKAQRRGYRNYEANKIIATCMNICCTVSKNIRNEIEETIFLPLNEIEKYKSKISHS
jgi:predicted ABC-type ATPase